MTEALGAEKGERVVGRQGYRSGYYGRTLITRVGKLELRVAQPMRLPLHPIEPLRSRPANPLHLVNLPCDKHDLACSVCQKAVKRHSGNRSYD
jgi:transposase-like protein